jgi:hypothetical protein
MMEIICDRIFEFGITTSLVFSVSLKFVVGGKTKNSSSAELTYSVIMGIPQNATGTSAVLLVSLNDHSTTNECEPHRKCHSRVVPPTRTICMFTGHISPHISPQVERNECGKKFGVPSVYANPNTFKHRYCWTALSLDSTPCFLC